MTKQTSPITNLSELTSALVAFRDARDWQQFHSPINLAVSLQLEATEVLECFQWKADDVVFQEWIKKPENYQALKEEMADVLAYLSLLANALDVDLIKEAGLKLQKNHDKYPVDKARGVSTKYNKL